MSLSNFFSGAQRFAGQALGQAQKVYQQADRATGGWLPGGGTASPITRAITPAQPFPKRSEELQRITGVRGRFIDQEKTPSLVRQLAPIVAPMWGTADYANPLLNEVGISGYSGGRTEREKHTEIHELGHLNPKDKSLYSHFGVLGRSLQGLSNQTGNLPLVDLAAGLALQHADAPEEDRAERFAKQFAKRQNYTAPTIYEDNTSNYGNQLRREGEELTSKGLAGLTNPFGIVSRTMEFVNEQRAKPIREEMSKLEPEMRKLFNSSDSYEVTPEQIRLGKRHSELQRQLESLDLK
jgi:hypothetical protein